jgi:hypothetical protein
MVFREIFFLPLRQPSIPAIFIKNILTLDLLSIQPSSLMLVMRSPAHHKGYDPIPITPKCFKAIKRITPSVRNLVIIQL